jgi:conjugal transfer pilus assembly protein TraB
VVTKSGALLARSFVAGFLDGFGRAIEEGAYDTSSSAIGDIRTLRPDKSFEAGIGRGIGEASGNLSKFYMELARQTFPVIEVGSGKRVSVVTSEGVELKIRTDVCLEGGRDGCRSKEHADGLGVLAATF